MNEKDIMDLILSQYSWEQVIYKIIALEGLDPWDLDLNLLSQSFLEYLSKLKTLDFRIPAKYILIASVLLRMKSDYLKIIEEESEIETEEEFLIEEVNNEEINGVLSPNFTIGSITVPKKRKPIRKITITELISALRRALKTEKRREIRKIKRRERIKIERDRTLERINILYERITNLLTRIKEKEVKFSNLVNRWEREEVINTFLPLLYLDHQKKVSCRQEKPFDEIFIRKREVNN